MHWKIKILAAVFTAAFFVVKKLFRYSAVLRLFQKFVNTPNFTVDFCTCFPI